MKILNKMKFVVLLLVILVQFIFVPVPEAHAATSPSLGAAGSYSVLGGETVTNTGATTMTGDLGVSPGSAVTGFPPGVIGPPGTLRSISDSALAQLANTATFLALSAAPNADCDTIYNSGTEDLGGKTLVPGIYCADAFSLSGTLTLNDSSASDVWIFRSAAALDTSSGPGEASVVFENDIASPCNVWWKVVSSATLGTYTAFIGNILASTSVTLQTGATLDGRAFAQTGAVTLGANTITGSSCLAGRSYAPNPSLTLTSGGASSAYCVDISEQVVPPSIITSKRIDADSVFLSWGPYSGINTFNVQYGTENGKWLYSTNVTGFSTTINNLPPNQPIWVRIAASNYCTIGDYGLPKLVGGPGLPNTGFAPRENNMWYIPMAIIFVGVFVLRLSPRH